MIIIFTKIVSKCLLKSLLKILPPLKVDDFEAMEILMAMTLRILRGIIILMGVMLGHSHQKCDGCYKVYNTVPVTSYQLHGHGSEQMSVLVSQKIKQ